MSTFRHAEAQPPTPGLRMKPWQWAVILTEAVLLFGVLGALAWMLLLNPPATLPAALPEPPVEAATSTPPRAATSTATPVPMALFTPLPTRTPQPTNTRVVSRVTLNQGTIDQIEQQVIRLRGLRPRATVPVEFLTRAQMLDYVRKGYEANKDVARREIAFYRALGLLAPQAKIDDEAVIQRIASNIAGFYEPGEKRLYVISDLENLGADEKVTLAHEYTHALQDQQFNLTRYQGRMRTTDMRLAMSSVYEGDATTVMSLYLYGNITQSEWDYLAYRASFADRSTITATNISTRVNQIEYFPYLQGSQFIVTLWADGKGWAQVNHAYADPPQSTSIVLHPERYLTSHATPIPIPLPDLGPTLGKEWTPTIKLDTLGEFITSVHLDEFLNDPKRAAQAADGWEGDSFTLWTTTGDHLVFAWQFAWSTPRDTGEFIDAYAELVRKRVGTGLVTERDEANIRWYSGSGGSGLIRRAGERTLILWGPDKVTVENLLRTFQ